MRKALFRSAAIAAAVALFTGVALANQPTTPDWFPEGFNLDSTAYSLRFAGDDRYETAGTISLIHATATEEASSTAYPFNEVEKADPGDTWGLDVFCVSGIGVSAGDTSADALAGSPAKDLLLDVDSAVDDDDVSGADTGEAFMLLTNSAREGATTLNADFEAAISTYVDETGCTDFDVLIFGGSEAIHTDLYDELDDLNGTGGVYVLGGVDRYETASLVAHEVFATSALPDLEHYPTPTSATFGTLPSANPDTLEDVVFLAEGVTGADALTIGPVAAANNAPVILTPTDSLSPFSADALDDLDPDTIVVLGGTAAISASTATAAAAAAPGDEEVIRIGGVDRWETSVLISEQLYGYYGENQDNDDFVGPGEHFNNLAFGFGRSEGAGAAFVGWPDVLSSAWFIDEYDDVSSSTPERAAPEWEQNEDYTFIGDGFWDPESEAGETLDSDNRTPLLVVQQGAAPHVDDYLESLWTQEDVAICNADPDPGDEGGDGATSNETGDCNNEGGFGFLFGGTDAIAATVEMNIALHLSGGTYESSDLTPTQTSGLVWYTDLDFSEYSQEETSTGEYADEDEGGPTGDIDVGASACWYRNALTGSQWAAVWETDGDFFDTDSVDFQDTETAFPRYQSRFWCVEAPEDVDGLGEADVNGVSLSGHETAVKSLDYSSESVILHSDTDGEDAACDETAFTDDGVFVEEGGNGQTATTTWECSGTWDFTYQDTSESDVDFDLEITVSRKDPAGGADGGTTGDDPDRFTATGTLTVDGTDIDFTATVTVEGFFATSCDADLDDCIRLSGMYSIGGILGGIHLTIDETDELFDLEMSGNA